MGFWKESREVGAELEPHPSKAWCIFDLASGKVAETREEKLEKLVSPCFFLFRITNTRMGKEEINTCPFNPIPATPTLGWLKWSTLNMIVAGSDYQSRI
ncbi:hypothetical protein L3X38_012770 [Prunus dulcis]|uniref:Uncharacterized protein n=1 Tax=Prunus dulcis TaxID=3755 RepID=A0AAD4WKQ3_PRUDU|nr:hypothetical protein L3X38_012770 [Prunus dulcis]